MLKYTLVYVIIMNNILSITLVFGIDVSKIGIFIHVMENRPTCEVGRPEYNECQLREHSRS